MLPGAGRRSWSRVVEAGWIGARIGYTMLFVIATKLDVFLQLTPEMQTHLPQPLNRISFGIILRTQAPGCDEDEGIQITEMQMHQLLLMDATQWLCVRKYVSVCVCLCVCGWQAAVVAHERVRKAKVLFSFSSYTRKSSHRLTLELPAGGHRQLTQSGSKLNPIFGNRTPPFVWQNNWKLKSMICAPISLGV